MLFLLIYQQPNHENRHYQYPNLQSMSRLEIRCFVSSGANSIANGNGELRASKLEDSDEYFLNLIDIS